MITHDYKRHGMAKIYAAMDVKSGLVIGDCQSRHRACEFIAFLRPISQVILPRESINGAWLPCVIR